MVSFVTLSKFLLIVELCSAFVHNTFVLQRRQNNIYTCVKLNRRSNDLINHNIGLEQNAKICINEIKRAETKLKYLNALLIMLSHVEKADDYSDSDSDIFLKKYRYLEAS